MGVISLEVVHKHGNIITGLSLEIAAVVSRTTIRARDKTVITHPVANHRIRVFKRLLLSRGGSSFVTRASAGPGLRRLRCPSLENFGPELEVRSY